MKHDKNCPQSFQNLPYEGNGTTYTCNHDTKCELGLNGLTYCDCNIRKLTSPTQVCPECKKTHCKHYESDFERYVSSTPLPSPLSEVTGDWEERFDKKFSKMNIDTEAFGYMPEGNKIKSFISSLLAHAREEGYNEGAHEASMVCNDKTVPMAVEKARMKGRLEILEEWDHEQKKMLDGFAHPKDCKL